MRLLISKFSSKMQVVFIYPLPPIPCHFQLILIENISNPIGFEPKSIQQAVKTLVPSLHRGSIGNISSIGITW